MFKLLLKSVIKSSLKFKHFDKTFATEFTGDCFQLAIQIWLENWPKGEVLRLTIAIRYLSHDCVRKHLFAQGKNFASHLAAISDCSIVQLQFIKENTETFDEENPSRLNN